jgi:hypothetical protein
MPSLRRHPMKALAVAFIYLAPFFIIGAIAKMLIKKRMEGSGLSDVHDLAGQNRRKRKVFLLGSWRDED